MHSIAMSRAGSGLLRAILNRAGVDSDRILLSDIRSRDWQSLTFVGERHSIALRIIGPAADATAQNLLSGIEEAEFVIPGQIVADISAAPPASQPDGSLTLAIKALTISE